MVLSFSSVGPIVKQLMFYPSLVQTKRSECSKQSGKFKVAELNKGVREKQQKTVWISRSLYVNLLNFELVLLNTTHGNK